MRQMTDEVPNVRGGKAAFNETPPTVDVHRPLLSLYVNCRFPSDTTFKIRW